MSDANRVEAWPDLRFAATFTRRSVPPALVVRLYDHTEGLEETLPVRVVTYSIHAARTSTCDEPGGADFFRVTDDDGFRRYCDALHRSHGMAREMLNPSI